MAFPILLLSIPCIKKQVMDNPFLLPVTKRLDNIESTLDSLSRLIPDPVSVEPKIVDLKGLLKHRAIVGTKATIYKLVHEGRLPHYKPEGSKMLYFLLEEVDNYLLGKKSKSSKDIKKETEKHLANS